MHHTVDPHFPFSSSDCYSQAVRKRFVRKFILFSLLFLTQCALDPHQFPSSSSSVAIRRQNTSHGAGRGGGGEEGWERFALDADLQSEGEEEEEDMHVLQSDAGAGGRGRGWGSPGGRATSAGWS